MSNAIIPLLAIAGAIALGAMSPGPSFVVVARTSVSRSRADGLLAAVGMGVGGVLFSAVALLGLFALLATVPWLFISLKVAGGLYLVHLAIRMWRHAAEPLAATGAASEHRNLRRSFLTALGTQVSNPKAAVVYGSVFAALMPQHPPVWWSFAIPPLVFVVEAGWYTAVALVFSSRAPKAGYARAKKWIDRVAAGVIGSLGVRLVITAPQS